jgi:microsomal epoxide hydrolase
MIEPFRVAVPDEALEDLAERLARARWPNQVAGAGWSQGTELGYLQELCEYWRTRFDWRKQEARLNSVPNYRTKVDGQLLHFAHLPSAEGGALPLVLMHGWPSSHLEYLGVMRALADPAARGGEARDAFHVVNPNLPGFAFSGPTHEAGWSPARMARAIAELMSRLGYERFGASGGDYGYYVSVELASLFPERVVGIELLSAIAPPPPGTDMARLDPEEREYLERAAAFAFEGSGYLHLQATRPQSLGYALEDSPVGLAAWILEKFRAWSDCGGDLESRFARDELLANVTLYWVTRTATSSLRAYYDTMGPGVPRDPGTGFPPMPRVEVPTGFAAFAGDVLVAPQRWIEAAWPRLVRYTRLPEGGHFPAWEVPELFLGEVRAFFRGLR